MKIIQLQGNDERVYAYIAKFAMDKEVIREFKGYPIFTDQTYVWFVALDGNNIMGFASLHLAKNDIILSNAYVLPEYRKKGVHKKLIQKRIEYCKGIGANTLIADCTKASLPNFLKKGANVVAEFKDWTKVKFSYER